MLSKVPALDSAQVIIIDILACHATLSAFSSLEPCPKVNEAFGRLVSICIRPLEPSVTAKVMSDPEIKAIMPRLQSLCSHGEGLLEHYWAKKLISASKAVRTVGDFTHHGHVITDQPMDILRIFPYHENYVDLTELELKALSKAMDVSKARRIAFIGSGPIPLSSICLLQQLSLQKKCANDGIEILNIDRCSQAIVASKELCRRLDLTAGNTGSTHNEKSGKMRFLCATARDGMDSLTGLTTRLAECDVVFVAALVGTSVSEKRGILDNLTKDMKAGSVLVVRTARGLRGLLYPVFDASIFSDSVEVVTTVHPDDHVVNSVIVAKVKKGCSRGIY